MRFAPLGCGLAAVLAWEAAGAPVGAAQEKVAAQAPPPVEITIDNFTFTPTEITISPGTTVRWVNHDDIPHTVVEAEKSFKSKTLDTDDSFSMTFKSTGSIVYFCSLHPHMTGKVIVKSGS
ncbi:cupredoxin family copper-binding protein [Alsobacter sp. KACC 23698]|uniref:Cupredoxin family copper-binding protein n=1 Tax=Alsobacter sp. KACC 23698 TaxID=3149229 RepID=A0AAU7JIL4_9HYPH